eukprot:8239066-Pyramimonas_sp.AAC.1
MGFSAWVGSGQTSSILRPAHGLEPVRGLANECIDQFSPSVPVLVGCASRHLGWSWSGQEGRGVEVDPLLCTFPWRPCCSACDCLTV